MPMVTVVITGQLDLSKEDAKALQRVSPSLAAQTLAANGKNIKVSVGVKAPKPAPERKAEA